MQVSVVIPALNEAAGIERSVRSAFDAGADEVIVGDGGSRDETAAEATRLGCRVVVSQAGRAIQQNAAAATATGDVLLFLHADNWLAPRSVDQLRAAVSETAGCGAFRQRIEARGLSYRALEAGNALRVRWLGAAYGDQGIFVRRDLFEACGGFPATPLMEDLLLMRSLRRRYWPRLLPGPLHVSPRRWQRHGVLRQTWRNWRLLAAERCGVSMETLARQYQRHDL